jgi:hypothetical protein
MRSSRKILNAGGFEEGLEKPIHCENLASVFDPSVLE